VINESTDTESDWHAYVYTETNDNGRIDMSEITYFMCGEGQISANDIAETNYP